MESIGVRELRQHASRWLARVEAGESFQITDRGRPVASLVPVATDAWDALVTTGSVILPGLPPADAPPLPHEGGPTLSEILETDRTDDR